MFCTNRVNQHQSCPACYLGACGMRDNLLLIPKLGQLFVYEHDFESLGFEITATGHFHFRNNKTEDMLVYQSNPVNLGETSKTTQPCQADCRRLTFIAKSKLIHVTLRLTPEITKKVQGLNIILVLYKNLRSWVGG